MRYTNTTYTYTKTFTILPCANEYHVIYKKYWYKDNNNKN